MKIKITFLLLLICSWQLQLHSQLKYVIEDFEGFSESPADLKTNGVFTFGFTKALSDKKMAVDQEYSGQRSLKITKENKLDFGGWGKGTGLNVQLDYSKDYLNFYVYQPGTNAASTIKIELQDDDNGNGNYDKYEDDSWTVSQKLEQKDAWNLISIPLSKFNDSNKEGDGIFNINYKEGKLLCFIISFTTLENRTGQTWSFDFICFSQGKLPTGKGIFDPPSASPDDFCALGAWSKEGNAANFTEIANAFEGNFKASTGKKLGVIHFFQPFAADGGNTQNHYPSIDRINKVVEGGYIPMVTLEDHFVNTDPNMKQPNLYSIIEGHFDSFFISWATQIKQVKGTVLLRILHEFNGDWYPWCIANNDKNPAVLIQAYKHIHDIFKAQQVGNVKFIWCPNSMSIPQEKWNYIMDAYPGDEYVDYVALDVYNGAGQSTLWRSFRKEAIENYFILTNNLLYKPLFICEVASRERTSSESLGAQSKGEWIKDMSDCLGTDMSKVRLLTWFNEKSTFKVNTSAEAQKAFLESIMKNEYFKSGKNELIRKYQFIGTN
ncbi:MAG: hypothetical protein M3R27_09200 [Bacteroidota bacterium]|nr:hypothetical protein [Bacteroidota bacterium]